MPDTLQQLHLSVIEGEGPVVRDLTLAALGEGIAAAEILAQALMPAMDEVGRRMAAGEYYIPEVLTAARTMSMPLEVLGPLLAAGGASQPGTAVIGTVKGDLHDIGKNLVGMMLRGANFAVVDLGTDVSAARFDDAARAHGADLICMSALLTTTMVETKAAIEALEEMGLSDRVKVMVGAAPVTQAFAGQVGADDYAPDAGTAVVVARQLLAG